MITTIADITTLFGGSLTAADTAILTLIQAGAERMVKKYIGYDPEYATGLVEFLPMGAERDSLGNKIGFEMVGSRATEYDASYTTDATHKILSLEQRPVRSIVSVYENPSAWDTAGGSFPADSLLTTDLYLIDYNKTLNSLPLGWSGLLIRQGGVWPRLPRTVKVTYAGGLSATEITNNYSELKLAVYDTCIKKFNEYKAQANTSGGSSGAVVAERLGDYSVQYDGSSAAAITGFSTDLPQSAKELLWDFVSMRKFLQV